MPYGARNSRWADDSEHEPSRRATMADTVASPAGETASPSIKPRQSAVPAPAPPATDACTEQIAVVFACVTGGPASPTAVNSAVEPKIAFQRLACVTRWIMLCPLRLPDPVPAAGCLFI